MKDMAKFIALSKAAIGVPSVPRSDSGTSAAHQQLITNAYGKTAWEDKTHYDDRQTITWDGEYKGLVQVGSGSNAAYKVSDLTPPMDAIIKKKFTWTAAGTAPDSVAYTKYSSFDWGLILTFKNATVWIVTSLPAKQGGKTFPETGTYLGISRGTYISSISWGELKQLDEKYIPSIVPVIQTATVGQTIAVKAVDENGKPTEWEAVDGGGNTSGGTSSLLFQMDSGANIRPSVCDFDFEEAMLHGTGIILTDGETGETMICISHSVPGNGNEYCVFYSALLKEYYHIVVEAATGNVSLNTGLPNMDLA